MTSSTTHNQPLSSNNTHRTAPHPSHVPQSSPYFPPLSRKLRGSFPMSSPVSFHHSGTTNRSVRLTANCTIGSLWTTCSQIMSTALPSRTGACTQPHAYHTQIGFGICGSHNKDSVYGDKKIRAHFLLVHLTRSLLFDRFSLSLQP